VIKRLRMTDVTRMRPPRVCVAGYDENNVCIRPVLRYAQIDESALEAAGGLITPFAEVEYDFTPAPSTPPHVEDHIYAPESVRWIRRLSESERHALLRATCRPRVDQAFGAPLVHISNHFVRMGSGACSLVTIQTRGAPTVHLLEKGERTQWRLLFRDSANQTYNLPITDLAWHYFVAVQQQYSAQDARALEARLNRLLCKDAVYLRVGLTREYPSGSHQCWLQVNSIFTFPDYLDGYTFADYRAGLKAHSAG
jgi:hypothetical protein